MVVLSEGRQMVIVPETDEDFSSTGTFNMDVWGAVFAGRGIDVNAESSLLMDFDHDEG
jgi:hypothetical protein